MCLRVIEEVVPEDVCMYAFVSGFRESTKDVQLT